MKGFTRTETRFSLCGLNCALCSMHLGGYCPGCGGSPGNQACTIARSEHTEYNTESLAKFAFSMFWRAMRFAEEQQVPILLDF